MNRLFRNLTFQVLVAVSLGVVVAILAITMVWSLRTAPRLPMRQEASSDPGR